MTPENIAASLPSLAGWSVVDGKLHREFKFADFIAAWGFMSRVALIAQSLDHHPDWSNVYNTVRIDLDTHDAGGITEKDFELARRIDALLPSG
jgi:4a-hydroxytetrahydrobiopterin dehydratase